MKESGFKKGLLLLDGDKNTILLDPVTTYDVLQHHHINLKENVRKHKTLSELDTDIRKYLKADYENPGGLRE